MNKQKRTTQEIREEKELLRRLLSQDQTAVREFYDRYAPLLLRFIRRKVDNEQDVEEIAQDTLFGFLEGARDFTGKCKLGTYVCTIASYKIVDYYRKKKLKRVLFSQMPHGLELLISEEAGPEEALHNKFTKEKINGVFANLAPQYRTILTMKYVEGRSVEEIASMLSCSFKSAESVLFRARKAFVKVFNGETYE